MTETMIETNGTEEACDMADLRWANDFLYLWRVCGGASCRRARSYRGRAHLCFKRNKDVVPKGARLFFEKLLAAKSVGLPFEEFREDMEYEEETIAFFAWRRGALKRPQ
jgi:hypothetical protein